MPDDQSSMPTQMVPIPPEPEGHGVSPTMAAAMLGAMRSASAGGWEPPMPEELQRSFPQYEIRGILGRGGMGAVYKGWQTSLDRFVAIKVLPPGVDDGGMNFADRFKQEAKAMAKFKHPGIVAVYDAGQTPEGLLYFIMECVDGTDVHQLVTASGKLPPAQALGIADRVCEALAYAHEHGVIHRDIKPSNIMIENDGTVKVADFGLAKVSTLQSAILTMTNVTMGTPEFMAPECMRGTAHADHRADLYAVGVMLYQMLTGTVPRGRFDPPSRAVPGLDKRLDRLVDKALQTDRDKRYSTATEMQTAIARIVPRARQFGTVSQKVAAVAKPRSLAKPVIIAAVALALAVGGWFIWKGAHGAAQRTSAPQPPTPSAIEPGAIRLWDSRKTVKKVAGRVDWANDAVKLEAGTGLYAESAARDAAIRASIGLKETDEAQLSLRDQNQHRYYVVVSTSKRSIRLFVNAPGRRNQSLHEWKFPRDYSADEWLRMELRAEGSRLTVLAEGKILGTVEDGAIDRAGIAGIYAANVACFRDIVYVPLDKPTSTAKPAPTRAGSYPQPTAWIDATAELRSSLVNNQTAVLENGWLRMLKPTTTVIASGRKLRDVAVRVTFAHQTGIFLRKSDSFNGSATSSEGKESLEFFDAPKQAAGSAKERLDGIRRPDSDQSAEHEFVFAAQGGRYAVWLDGAETVHGRHPSATSGLIGLQINPFELAAAAPRIKKIEYAELPGDTPASSPVPK